MVFQDSRKNGTAAPLKTIRLKLSNSKSPTKVAPDTYQGL